MLVVGLPAGCACVGGGHHYLRPGSCLDSHVETVVDKAPGQGKPTRAAQHWGHVDAVLLKQAQAFISHVRVSVCCVLLEGPTGPERQFCSIYKGSTAAFLPDLVMFHIPRSPAFGLAVCWDALFS